VKICKQCGAAVKDPKRHKQWHKQNGPVPGPPGPPGPMGISGPVGAAEPRGDAEVKGVRSILRKRPKRP
jgi:hypothetical protein